MYVLYGCPLTKEVVLRILKELKVEVPGIDNSVPMFLKEVSDGMADIVILYQKSIENSTIPQEWLQAIITVI